MRITGGLLKNRPLVTPKGLTTRPTASRVRESIFNICQFYIEGAGVLDLFSGTGVLAIEALSRGAENAILIDNDTQSQNCIDKNLKNFELTQAQFLFGDALEWVRRFSSQGKTFDLIFADPPYNQGFGEKLVQLIDEGQLLAEGGIFFLEEGKELHVETKNLQLKKCRKYGRAWVHQFILL